MPLCGWSLCDKSSYSNDLDFFPDSVERVASAFKLDQELLVDEGYGVDVVMSQPGYIRALVKKGDEESKLEWEHDSAWRFLPPVYSEAYGYVLHPIDLAINKVLSLAGRNEARDFIDVLHSHHQVLSLGAQCWAAAGKDLGFTSLSLFELLRRRSKLRPEGFARLHLKTPVDLPHLKTEWMTALKKAEAFIRSRQPEEMNCFYYSPSKQAFVEPGPNSDAKPHFGRLGGVIPLPSTV